MSRPHRKALRALYREYYGEGWSAREDLRAEYKAGLLPMGVEEEVELRRASETTRVEDDYKSRS